MRAKNIFQQAMDYAEGAEPWEYSHADYYTLVPKMTLADKDLDFYTLGVLMRLYLLAYYKYDWTKIYDFGGSKEYIDRALEKLNKNNYVKWEGNNLILI